MSWLKRALWSAAAVAVIVSPAPAQVAGRPLELSGGAGIFVPDARARMKSGPAYRGALGWRMMPGFTLEGHGTFGPSEADTAPNQAHNFSMGGIDLRWNLRPADGRAVPFVLVGGGYGLSHTSGRKPDRLERGAATIGVGVLRNTFDQRLFVRIEARDVMFKEHDQREFSHHFAATAGLQWVLFGRERDQDLDRVRDWIDRCRDTPIGARVDANGCPTDSDGDGVFDGLDKCEGTPRGCQVDKDGCPKDSDGDGVCDGLDQCADTPAGARVDPRGCPTDADGDGVLDGLDQCENTPKGCTVSGTGCPVDSDADGVCDGLDRCPNTPAGLKVDPNGCPIEVSEREVELLDTGMIRLRNINFDVGRATLKPESFAILDQVGGILQQYPQLAIEVGGHTDDRGSKALNDTLSASRAAVVLDYVRQRFPAIAQGQFTAKGYGSSDPVAPNASELGRAKNRRVEFKVLNTDVLRIERVRRRYVREGESVPPPDTTRAAPPDTTRR